MGNIGDPVTQPIPAVGSSGTTYATEVNAFLTEVKTRLEADVPKTSLAAGPLEMGGYSIQQASYVGINNGASAPTSPSNTLQAFGGNLYWINTGGAVQITDGAGLNTASFGGITGDYGGANPAQWRFVDADQEFYAYDNYAAGEWARVWAKNFDIAASNTSTNRVRLAYGGAGSYTLTLPAGTPGAATILQMSNTGAVTANNQLASVLEVNDIRFTTQRDRVFPTFSGIEATAGSHTKNFPAGWTLGNSTNAIYVPLNFDALDKIIEIYLYVNKASDATNTLTCRLESYDSTGAQTNIATGTLGTNAPGATSVPLTGINHVKTATEQLILRIWQTDNTPSAADNIYQAQIKYTRPI